MHSRRGTRRIALTGGIATGKSHVRAEFERLGIPTVDADLLARKAVEPGSPGLAAVVARFGTAIIDASGALDRRRMADIVFKDTQARQDLEAIVHPIVRRATEDWFASVDASRHPFAIADIPLLFETGRDGEFDVIIVTACEPDTQMKRVMTRDSLSNDEAHRRIMAQLPLAEKVRRATYVIRTDGTFAETSAQVADVYRRLHHEAA